MNPLQENPCVEDVSYSFTQCIIEYTRRKTKCHFDIFSSDQKSSISCDKKAFEDYVKLLVWIKQSRITLVQEETGCQQKCSIIQYSYETRQKDITWSAPWTAEVKILFIS